MAVMAVNESFVALMGRLKSGEDEAAREVVYGMPYAEWKAKYQK